MEVKSLRKPMNNGYILFGKTKITLFRRPPQVKSSKSQIHAKFHKIPVIRFEDQKLTSFSGLIVFQLLFNGKLTLSMSANQAVQKDFMHFLDTLQKAA